MEPWESICQCTLGCGKQICASGVLMRRTPVCLRHGQMPWDLGHLCWLSLSQLFGQAAQATAPCCPLVAASVACDMSDMEVSICTCTAKVTLNLLIVGLAIAAAGNQRYWACGICIDHAFGHFAGD